MTKVQYTYQEAIDITSPRDNYYRDQIPYIPWHSGSAILNLSYDDWSLNYSFVYVGNGTISKKISNIIMCSRGTRAIYLW